ncbi:MAG TPA: RNA 3'-terminal phosphate cyclase [Candidatus Caldiarchaeum subterraneum]|uniref:RNA 3'-terminal phosphate cyclase n=1 Tax=Caldiarchaeum subterraneum TaxID=311458 RepID=A0A833EC38_CALS0|nr:RNA 3'-terminal phosphate cyclase [Candidatus Caldarchaeum subterraneum]
MYVEELVVDGAFGEGGGQILRTSVAVAAVMQRPLRVFNIRAKRRPPGLRPQHLTAVKAVAQLSNASVSGLAVGSTEIRFYPSRVRGGRFEFDAGTAGSTTLILQSLMPVMAFADSGVEALIRGGTNNPLAPPLEYLENVVLPVLAKMGAVFKVRLHRRGFYPRGQGVISAHSSPVKVLNPINLTGRPKVRRVTGMAYSCRLPEHITERMAKAAEKMLRERGYDAEISREALQPNNPRCSPDPGTGIILYAWAGDLALGVDKLGEKGVPAEKVAEEAVKSILEEIDAEAPVDSHLGDQLVVWTALAEGVSEYETTRLTTHTTTAIEVCRRLTGAEFEVEGNLGGRARIKCRGVGHRNRYLE